jgi:hypothetical protein
MTGLGHSESIVALYVKAIGLGIDTYGYDLQSMKDAERQVILADMDVNYFPRMNTDLI